MFQIKKVVLLFIFCYSISIIYRSINLKELINASANIDLIDETDYFLNFHHSKEAEAIHLDSNNIYYVDYSKIKSLGVLNQKSYYPITIGLGSLRSLQAFKLTNDSLYYKIFIANSDWLCENIDSSGNWPTLHNKKIGNEELIAPWPSAMSQGLALSVLTRAYKITNDSTYLFYARKAVLSFGKTIKEGGVRTNNEFGVFYEEYPLENNPTHVLNGFLYSLFGLYDLSELDNNLLAKKYFEDGFLTLKTILSMYDLGNWTRYDLNINKNLKNHWGYSSPWYQKLHVAQLKSIYLITEEKTISDFAVKFAIQEKSSFVNYVIYPAYVLYTDFVYLKRSLL